MHSHKKIFLGHLAQSRGLFGDMLVAIATAFGQLLALDTDNVKHLQVIAIFYTEKWTFEIIYRLSYRAKRVKKDGK